MRQAKGDEGMYFLGAFILLLIVSIGSAMDGDWSGLELIGRIVGAVLGFLIVGGIIVALTPGA